MYWSGVAELVACRTANENQPTRLPAAINPITPAAIHARVDTLPGDPDCRLRLTSSTSAANPDIVW
jgi:hypothetical protein